MKWTVLGSGNGVPTARRGCPGHLLRAGGRNLLVDPGPGALRAAAAAGVGPGEVHGVLVSHLHPDHHLDLLALLFALRHPGFAGRGPLTVVGPRGLAAVVGLWYEAYGRWIEPRDYVLDLREVGPGPVDLPPLLVHAVEVPHGMTHPRDDAPLPSLGWRVAEGPDGPVLAFSGDTGEGPGAVETGRDADLYVVECTVPRGGDGGRHLAPEAVARIATAARCRRLLLVHFAPECDAADSLAAVRSLWDGDVVAAEDGMEVRA